MAEKNSPATIRLRQRVKDLLDAQVPVWKICEIIKLSEPALRRKCAAVFEEHGNIPGPREWEPSPNEIRQMELMAGLGIKNRDIALVIGVSKAMLEARCSDIIARSRVVMHMRVGANIYKMATGDPNHKNTALTAIFYAKSQMGWQERDRMEITGAEGGPVQSQVQIFLPDNGRDQPQIEGPNVIDGDAQDVDDNEDISAD